VSQDGLVKVLDFGLARAYDGDDSDSSNDAGTSPTLTAAMTQAGVILGTAAYMSPEQARGHAVDNRTDIWAFGVIFWELLAGRRLFAGETVSDTLAMVLRSEPDWEALPAELPPSLLRLIQRCLQRDKRQRMHHIADARIVLEEVVQDGTSAYEPVTGPMAPSSSIGGRSSQLGWAAAIAMTLLAAFFGWQSIRPQTGPDPQVVNFDLQLPSDLWVYSESQPLVISPDGETIVMCLKTPTGAQLFQRTLGNTEVNPIPFTEGGYAPYFSRDGKWLTFVQQAKLQKMPISGGAAITVTDQVWGGGTWTSDERIVFTKSYDKGLFIISAEGGQPQALTEPDSTHNELGHWWPQVLPDDDWVVYSAYATPIEKSRLMAYSLKTGETKPLVENAVFGRYSSSGHLLFVRGTNLMALAFDPNNLQVSGTPQPVLDDVHLNPSEGYSNFAVADNGTFIHLTNTESSPPSRLSWVDRQGTITPLEFPAKNIRDFSLSPDNTRIAVSVSETHSPDIWLYELDRGTTSRFTFSPSSDFGPIWSPDGKTIYYSAESPQFTIHQRPTNGSRGTELLFKRENDTNPTDVTPDGKFVLVSYNSNVNTASDIWMLPVDDPSQPQLIFQGPFNESQAKLSPNGRWLSFISNESGRGELYVSSFPEIGSRIRISIEGCDTSQWSSNGDEIFLSGPSGHKVVTVNAQGSTAESLEIGRPQPLFDGPGKESLLADTAIVAAKGGQRFLVAHTPDEAQPHILHVTLNWFSLLPAD
jgi:Tol biopolymer transport system component